MQHVMIDLETMGTKSDAAIISIAAVLFDIETGECGDSIHLPITLESSMQLGLKPDANTIKWWMQQSNEAREKIYSSSTIAYDIEYALQRLGDLCYDSPYKYNVQPWGNGARFDLGILETAYTLAKKPLPWNFWNERDVRTLLWLAPGIKESIPFEGTKHDALADCLHQIKQVCAAYKIVKTHLPWTQTKQEN